jgi:hypothetical protein
MRLQPAHRRGEAATLADMPAPDVVRLPGRALLPGTLFFPADELSIANRY